MPIPVRGLEAVGHLKQLIKTAGDEINLNEAIGKLSAYGFTVEEAHCVVHEAIRIGTIYEPRSGVIAWTYAGARCP